MTEVGDRLAKLAAPNPIPTDPEDPDHRFQIETIASDLHEIVLVRSIADHPAQVKCTEPDAADLHDLAGSQRFQ